MSEQLSLNLVMQPTHCVIRGAQVCARTCERTDIYLCLLSVVKTIEKQRTVTLSAIHANWFREKWTELSE